MKILTILGARPQFIKAGTVSREIAKQNEIEELIDHNFNVLSGADKEKIISLYRLHQFNDDFQIDLYGEGKASEVIVNHLKKR